MRRTEQRPRLVWPWLPLSSSAAARTPPAEQEARFTMDAVSSAWISLIKQMHNNLRHDWTNPFSRLEMLSEAYLYGQRWRAARRRRPRASPSQVSMLANWPSRPRCCTSRQQQHQAQAEQEVRCCFSIAAGCRCDSISSDMITCTGVSS
jgi:hypothetical protein